MRMAERLSEHDALWEWKRCVDVNDFIGMQQLVDSDSIRPDMAFKEDLLLSPSTHAVRNKKWEALKILFSKEPGKIQTAVVYIGVFQDNKIIANGTHHSLIKGIVDYHPETYSFLLKTFPDITTKKILPEESIILDLAVRNRKLSIKDLDGLEKSLGHCRFLDLQNNRGETLIFSIIEKIHNIGRDEALDLASWILKRRPHFANQKDALDWTPLDRLSLQAEFTKMRMTALLLTYNAVFERQIAPDFNLVAEIEKRGGAVIQKPDYRPEEQPALGQSVKTPPAFGQ